MKLLPSVVLLSLVSLNVGAQWSQMGANPKHTGSVPVAAQPLLHLLSDITYDPFVAQEQEQEFGDLLVHYQVPLVDGDDVYMEFKAGQFTSPDHWETQIWSIHGLRWQNDALVDRWTATSDWKPVPALGAAGWEPVFHAVLANGFVYMPATGGTLLQLDRNDGHVIKRINPFASVDPHVYVSGVPAADAAGNIYYGAFRLDAAALWTKDITGAWLIRVKPDGSAASVTFAPIVPNAPNATYQGPKSGRSRPPRPRPRTANTAHRAGPAGTWPPGHTGQTLLDLTGQMYAYHNNLSSAHPASSPWWAWPMNLKTVWFYQEGLAGGTSAAIYDAGRLVS